MKAALARSAGLAFLFIGVFAWPGRSEEGPEIVLAAGDIALCGSHGAEATARLLDRLPGTILALGDLAYEEGTAAEFDRCYDPTWGRHKARTWPVPGNHEYETERGDPYYGYWGERAGPRGRGYYSLAIGAWRVLALNSNIESGPGSDQLNWLRRTLAAAEERCILAFWHEPVFGSGRHGQGDKMLPAFELLYDSGVSVVLAGHDHHYERLAPVNPLGGIDRDRGIRAFIVGTGGAPLRGMGQHRVYSRFWYVNTWGVLRLALYPERYEWAFVTVDGRTIDSGAADCVDRDELGSGQAPLRLQFNSTTGRGHPLR